MARTFGAPETVPAGKHARRRSKRVPAGRELARDLRDEVGDVRVALGLEEADDAHRAGRADAREVVAAEVDEHDVLGLVLLGGEQLARRRPRRASSCPAIGLRDARVPSSLTSVSGEEPTSETPSSSSRKW